MVLRVRGLSKVSKKRLAKNGQIRQGYEGILLTVHSQCHKSAEDQGYDGQ